jgi:hypothetical protein
MFRQKEEVFIMFTYNSIVNEFINDKLDLDKIWKSSERLGIYAFAIVINFTLETGIGINSEADKEDPVYKEWESRTSRIKKVRYLADELLDAYIARGNE